MSVQQSVSTAYAFNNGPLASIFPVPIVSKRAPTTGDHAQLGTLWIEPVDTSGTAINSAWILTSIINNLANWILVETGGGSGVFSSLTVTPGPISLTGTTTINTTGSAVTTIGTGGTGAVHIGNATGNTAVTGSLTASTGLTATTGGITASAGGASITGTTNINTSGAAVTSINTGGTGALNLGNATGNTAVTGSLSTTTTMTAATGLTVTLGNATLTNGNLVLSTAATKLTLPGPINIMTGAGAPSNGLAVEVGDMYINTTAASSTTRLYIATAASTWTNVTCAG